MNLLLSVNGDDDAMNTVSVAERAVQLNLIFQMIVSNQSLQTSHNIPRTF
jgi:hypothetical protein